MIITSVFSGDGRRMRRNSRTRIFQRDRPANKADRLVIAAKLVSDDAEKVQAVELILIDCEDFPVRRFSVCKPSGRMVLPSPGQ